MKLSISVPDDLWLRAQNLSSEVSPSALVQEVLFSWVTDRELSAGYSTAAPPDVGTELESIGSRLSIEAREEFERGYRAGVSAAAKSPWWAIEALVAERFDVKDWAKRVRRWAEMADRREPGFELQAEDQVWINALIETLGDLVHPWGGKEWIPPATYIRGFSRAMRDLWEMVEEGRVKQNTKPADDPLGVPDRSDGEKETWAPTAGVGSKEVVQQKNADKNQKDD